MVQTLKNDPTQSAVFTGVLIEQGDGRVVVSLPGSEYQLLLCVEQLLSVAPGKRVSGVIHAVAKRVDVVHHGGRFIEPVYGRPRRVQGVVTATNANDNTITVCSRCPFVCRLSGSQKAGDFALRSLVGFDIESGAVFAPADDESNA